MRRPLENFASDFLFPLAGLMLTILPLRTVFVPSQITGVTRIDYVLGYQVLILLCAAVVAYGLNLWCLRPAKTSKPAPASARAQRLHLRWQRRLLKRQPRLPHNGD